MTIAFPKAKVFINQRQVKIRDVDNAIDVDYGSVGQPMSTATIQVIQPPFTPKWKMPVTVTWGYDVADKYGFTGFIVNPQHNSYPDFWTILAKDVLWLADYAAPEEINLLNNKTAREVILILLKDYAGIPEQRLIIPEIYSAEGQPAILGKLTPILFTNETPLKGALRIATMFGYSIYADEAGIVRMRQQTGAPTESYAYLYAQGVNIFTSGPPAVNSDIEQVFNLAAVTGGPTGYGGATVHDTFRVDRDDILLHGKDRLFSYSEPLIEYASIELGGAGSCEAIAARLVREHSRDPFTVTLDNVAAQPGKVFRGQTVALQTSRLGLTTPRSFNVMALHRTFGRGKFRDTGVVLDGGLGPEGYSVNPDPEASFTYKLFQETESNGQTYIDVFLDASTSKAFSGAEIVDYQWSDNFIPQNTGIGQRVVFKYPKLDALTSVQITLIVTDTNGKSGEVSQYISLVLGPNGVPSSRTLNVAAGNTWYVTPDTGLNWTHVSGAPTTAVPPISALGSIEADATAAADVGLLATGGASTADMSVRATKDYLATAPTTLGATSGGFINFIWQHEKDPKRIWRAVGDHLQLSTDGGSTWVSKPAPEAGTSVLWVVEAIDNIGVLDVLVGPNVYTSFDEGATYSITFDGVLGSTAKCYTSGFDRHWVGYTGLSAPSSPLRSTEGDVAAFPDVTPPVVEIRAVTMMVETPELIAFDQIGRVWKLRVTDGGAAEQIGVLPDNDVPQHAIRDGDFRVVWCVGNKALYKVLIDAKSVAVILVFDPVTEQGHMVGYGNLAVPLPPPIEIELIDCPSAFPVGGVITDPIKKWTNTTGWIDLCPVPNTKMPISGIAVSTLDPNRFVVWGTASDASTSGPDINHKVMSFYETQDNGITFTDVTPTDRDTGGLALASAVYSKTSGDLCVVGAIAGYATNSVGVPVSKWRLWRNGTTVADTQSNGWLLSYERLYGLIAGEDDDIIFCVAEKGRAEPNAIFMYYNAKGSNDLIRIGGDFNNPALGLTQQALEFHPTFSKDPQSRKLVIWGDGSNLTRYYKMDDYRVPDSMVTAGTASATISDVKWISGFIAASLSNTLQLATYDPSTFVEVFAGDAADLFGFESVKKAAQSTETGLAARWAHGSSRKFTIFDGVDWGIAPDSGLWRVTGSGANSYAVMQTGATNPATPPDGTGSTPPPTPPGGSTSPPPTFLVWPTDVKLAVVNHGWVKFTATETVTWSLEGAHGGAAAGGTITSDGLLHITPSDITAIANATGYDRFIYVVGTGSNGATVKSKVTVHTLLPNTAGPQFDVLSPDEATIATNYAFQVYSTDSIGSTLNVNPATNGGSTYTAHTVLADGSLSDPVTGLLDSSGVFTATTVGKYAIRTIAERLNPTTGTMQTVGDYLFITVVTASVVTGGTGGGSTGGSVQAPVITAQTVAVTVGQAASGQVTASNNPSSYGTSGSLPEGFSLDHPTGIWHWTPLAYQAGIGYTITVNATNSGGTGVGTMTFNVSAPISSSSVPGALAASVDLYGPARGYFDWGGQHVVPVPSPAPVAYTRGDWVDFEKSKGVYDWSKYDKLLPPIGSGRTVGFRVPKSMTSSGVKVPAYLQQTGLGFWSGSLWVPDLNNTTVLTALTNLIGHMGERYGSDQRLFFMDATPWGKWHEGHFYQITFPTGYKLPTDATLKTLMDACNAAFPNMFKFIQYSTNDYAKDYAWQLGSKWGVRGDSIGWADWNSKWSKMRNSSNANIRNLANERWKTAPVWSENGNPLETGYAARIGLQITSEHVSGFGNGNFNNAAGSLSWGNLDQEQLLLDGALLGYRYRITSQSISNGSGTWQVSLAFVNEGVAPIYLATTIKAQLRDQSTGAVVSEILCNSNNDLRTLLPSQTVAVTGTGTAPSAGNYALHAIVTCEHNGTVVVPLAMDGKQSDGSYKLGVVTI